MAGGAPYSDELTQRLQSIPSCVTPTQANKILMDVAAWGDQQLASGVSFWGWASLDTDPNVPIKAAYDLAAEFRRKIPWFTADPQYCDGSPEKTALINTVSNVYGNASAVKGESDVADQAVQQFGQDIKDNVAKAASITWNVTTIIVALVVGILLLVYVVPLFRR